MSVKAKLTIILQADDTVVAETEDAALWQRVLQAINQGGKHNLTENLVAPEFESGETPKADLPGGGNAVDNLANELGIVREVLEGAAAPNMAEPYMHLDMHCWEAMKNQTPARGPSAYSPIAIAATLLTLWFRSAGLGNPTQAQAQAVLGTINLQDRNPGRGIQRSEWLQTRPGGMIVLNPAQASKALALAKSFCTKSWKTEPKAR
jgi:hypothetical protein